MLMVSLRKAERIRAIKLHYLDDLDGSHSPYITLEVMTAPDDDHIQFQTTTIETELQNSSQENIVIQDNSMLSAGMHFLTVNPLISPSKTTPDDTEETEDTADEQSTSKCELLEYMTRNNGTVICKFCGEILRSRTHWYRHKYKLHAIPPLNPAPLFQCEQCLVFFKSRKGYIGHLASRHNMVLSDSNQVPPPAVTTEDNAKEMPPEVDEELDVEMAVPASKVSSSLVAVAAAANPVKTVSQKSTMTGDAKRLPKGIKEASQVSNKYNKDLEARRLREEKLVADIIDRVRRECEAQGSGGSTRKGYTRRTTVMHT